MAITLTYGGLNINDGTNYVLLDGMDPGQPQKTWDEFRSYTGEVAQKNVSEAHLIEMHVPLLIKGTNLAGVKANIAAINALIDAGAQDLVFDDGTGSSVTYSCVSSPRVNVPFDVMLAVRFAVVVDLVLFRTP